MDRLALKAIVNFDIHIRQGEIIPPAVQSWLASTGRSQEYLEKGYVALGVVE